MRLMFPAVFFTALAGVGMGVHRSYRNFAPPMWGPIVYNAMIIASTYLLGRVMGIVGMAYGTVAGAIANFSVQLPFVVKKMRGKRLALDFSHPGLKQIFGLMGPAVVSLSIYQINFIIVSNLASGLAEGSPTALKIAQTMVQLPLGVFGMGIGMVILPNLARLIAQKELAAFRETFSQGIRTVFFVTIPSAVGLAVLRRPLLRLLFETGEFGPRRYRDGRLRPPLFHHRRVGASGGASADASVLRPAGYEDAGQGEPGRPRPQHGAFPLFHQLYAPGARRPRSAPTRLR